MWNRETRGNSRAAVRMHGEAEDFHLEHNVEPVLLLLLLLLLLLN